MAYEKPTTGKVCFKNYECTRCGHQSQISTNHWGECYPKCPKCSWKYPLEMGVPHRCLDPVPEGYGVPTKWKIVKLGDVAEVIKG